MFVDDGYEIRKNSWCSPYRDEPFPNLSEAKRECNNDPSCTMLYDGAGQGKTIYLCDEGAEIKKSTMDSILHIKKGEFLRHFIMLLTII